MKKKKKSLLDILLFIPRQFMKDYFEREEEKEPFRIRAKDMLIHGYINEVTEFEKQEVYLLNDF